MHVATERSSSEGSDISSLFSSTAVPSSHSGRAPATFSGSFCRPPKQHSIPDSDLKKNVHRGDYETEVGENQIQGIVHEVTMRHILDQQQQQQQQQQQRRQSRWDWANRRPQESSTRSFVHQKTAGATTGQETSPHLSQQHWGQPNAAQLKDFVSQVKAQYIRQFEATSANSTELLHKHSLGFDNPQLPTPTMSHYASSAPLEQRADRSLLSFSSMAESVGTLGDVRWPRTAYGQHAPMPEHQVPFYSTRQHELHRDQRRLCVTWVDSAGICRPHEDYSRCSPMPQDFPACEGQPRGGAHVDARFPACKALNGGKWGGESPKSRGVNEAKQPMFPARITPVSAKTVDDSERVPLSERGEVPCPPVLHCPAEESLSMVPMTQSGCLLHSFKVRCKESGISSAASVEKNWSPPTSSAAAKDKKQSADYAFECASEAARGSYSKLGRTALDKPGTWGLHEKEESTTGTDGIAVNSPAVLCAHSIQRGFAESPATRLAFKEFYRQFRAKEKYLPGGSVAAREHALECLTDDLIPRKVHWRLYLELADLAKRENNWEEARRLYSTACESQPYVIINIKFLSGSCDHS
jgi:hypothetical protein